MKDIKKYEAMAKLDLPDAERQYISDLADEIEYSFKAFADIDTDNTEPMFTVLDRVNVLREDISKKMISREELLAGAPMQYDGYFQVPRTI